MGWDFASPADQAGAQYLMNSAPADVKVYMQSTERTPYPSCLADIARAMGQYEFRLCLLPQVPGPEGDGSLKRFESEDQDTPLQPL